MPWYFRWYETSSGEAESHTYRTSQGAEQERSLARAWGWNSSPARAHRKGNMKNGQVKYEYVVSYSRTPSAVAAADVKRHWAYVTELKAGLSRAQQSVKASLTVMSSVVDEARTEETNPIALERRLLTAIHGCAYACSERAKKRTEMAKHYEAAHNAHQNVVWMMPLISEMGIPARSDVKTSLEQHTRDHTDELSQAQSLEPAIAAQERVVTAVEEWQAAIRDRWTAQRAYMPVETWWDRLSVKLEAKPRPTRVIPVSKETVATQILHADEVGPEDEAWKQAEAEVARTEAVLVDAIQARDAVLAKVAKAYGLNS